LKSEKVLCHDHREAMANLQIFISHSHWDWTLAGAWKDLLVGMSDGAIAVWLSSDSSADHGMPFGHEWRAVIYEQLKDATIVLAVLTPESLRHPWLWWECGVATGLERKRKLERRPDSRAAVPVSNQRGIR